MKTQLKKLLYSCGFEVRRAGLPRPGVHEFLEARGIETVLDVGANIGQFGSGLRNRGYRGRIISFEPIKGVFATLKGLADRDGNWEAHNYALGSARLVKNIQISERTEFSSLLEQTPVAQDFDPRARVIRQESVEVKRLDDIFPQIQGGRVFLKIDAQGFEREILEGAPATLKQVLGVQAELPLMHLYQGVWSLSEALEYMRQRQFILCQVEPTNYDTKDRVSMVELDCIFRRMDPRDQR
jgi:FkbM family methyltransferase